MSAIQTAQKQQIKTEVYERLKIWDRKRAQTLKYHKKAIQQIYESIEKKIEQSKDFLLSIKTMLEERVNQLKTYCLNSIVDSDFVFEKNKNQAYTAHHQLLKQFYNIETDFTAQQSSKQTKLFDLLQNLKTLTDIDDSNESKSNCQQFSSVTSIQSNIKYMMQLQLPEINQKTVTLGETLSKIYNDNLQKDLYLAIDQFIRGAEQQANKHRDIAKQLVSLTDSSIKRQTLIQTEVKNCLKSWAEIDGPIDPTFGQQLGGKNIGENVEHFYEISAMTNVNFDEASIQEFLTNFKIQNFIDHDKLKLSDIKGFYNSKIQTRIIITIDNYLHLIRPKTNQPDFSLHLNPDLIIRKIKQCNLQLTQYKKKFYFKKQKQFQFILEFKNQNDLFCIKICIQKICNGKIS